MNIDVNDANCSADDDTADDADDDDAADDVADDDALTFNNRAALFATVCFVNILPSCVVGNDAFGWPFDVDDDFLFRLLIPTRGGR